MQWDAYTVYNNGEINMHLHTYTCTHSVPVPIEILTDDLVETNEDFQLALISSEENPSTNLAIGPNIDAQVVITDEGGEAVSLGSHQYILS